MKITTKSYKKAQLKNRLAVIRFQRGFTQTELARRAGTTQQTISAIESDNYNPSVILALALASVLNCKVEDLFAFDPDQEWLYGNLITIIKEDQSK